MGITVSAYITCRIDNAKLITAAAVSTDRKPTLKANGEIIDGINNTGFLQQLNDVDIIVDKTTSTADIPDSIEDEFDVLYLAIEDIKYARDVTALASVYRPNDSDDPFTIRVSSGLRSVYARVTFTGTGAYGAAKKFAQLTGPDRVIVVNEQDGEAYEGAEFIEMMSF